MKSEETPYFCMTREEIFGPIDPPLHRFRDSYFLLCEKLEEKGWTMVGEGRHRAVFKAPSCDVALKVSKVPRGVEANLFELFHAERGTSFSRDTWDGTVCIPIPEVKGHFRLGDLSVLCVEWVERTPRIGGTLSTDPNWVRHVDADGYGPQIGTTKQGRLVCFDWCVF